MRGFRIKKSIEVFFVIILILGLCISAVVLMDAGRRTYARILENNNQLDNARTALSYFSMRIRQNDEAGGIAFTKNAINGSDAVVLKHSGDEEGLLTYIFFNDGKLMEIYTWAAVEPDSEDGETIARLNGFDIEYNEINKYIRVTAHYKEDGNNKQMEQIIGIVSD